MTELATTAQAKELHRKFTEDVLAMPSGEKINICQQCEVFQSMIPSLIGNRDSVSRSSSSAI